MSFNTISVYLDDVARAPELVRAASLVAADHSAHLVGFYIVHPLDLYVARIAETSISTDIRSALYQNQVDTMQKLKGIFTKLTKNQDFSSEWRYIDNKVDSIHTLLVRQSAVTDLLIMSQGSPSSGAEQHNELERALIDSTAPILMVPTEFDHDTIGQHVLAGWDMKASAGRAIQAALPFMNSAEKVQVIRLTRDPESDEFQSNIDTELENMLSRHGTDAKLKISKTQTRNAGEALHAEAELRGSDLIVIGAFGHARVREIIFGGATRFLVKQSKIPLLMTH